MGGNAQAERSRSSKVGSTPLRLEVLVMGCQGAGKTLLVRRIKQLCKKRVPDDILDTQPTLGVELDEVPYGGAALIFREVGGTFVQVWSNFFDDCGAWAFVIDVSDAMSCSRAIIEMWDVLNHPKMRGKRVLLVLNKCDALVVLSTEELDAMLRLHDMQRILGSQMSIIRTSAHTGVGVEDVLKFFLQVCKDPVRCL